jgi:Protein of unknown function (DUF2975)
MNPQVEARLEKVKRTSRAARRVCFWLMGLVSLMAAVMAAGTLASPDTMLCDVNGLRQPCNDLSPQAVTVTLIAMIGGVALALTGLYRLSRLFQNYARGEIFTRASVREIRLLGYVAVGYALLQFVLFVAWLALSAGADAWPANVRGDLPIGPVVVASFILLFSWVMDVGAELREENELTV